MDKLDSSDSQITEEAPKREGSVNRSQEIPQSIRKKLEESPDINFCKNQDMDNSRNISSDRSKSDVSSFGGQSMPTSRNKFRFGAKRGQVEIENDFIK